MSRNSEKPLIQTESLKQQNCETMPSNKKSGSSHHSALQICVVFTFVGVSFLDVGKFTNFLQPTADEC